MSDKIQAKVDMLERTVLELGSELYNLRGRVAKAQESQEQFLAVFNGLKLLLDEKGLITLDDFDSAVELGEVLQEFHSQSSQSVRTELEKGKKSN